MLWFSFHYHRPLTYSLIKCTAGEKKKAWTPAKRCTGNFRLRQKLMSLHEKHVSHSRISRRKKIEAFWARITGRRCQRRILQTDMKIRWNTDKARNSKCGQCKFSDNAGESTEVVRQWREETSFWAELITEHVGGRTERVEINPAAALPVLPWKCQCSGRKEWYDQHVVTAKVWISNCSGTWKFNFSSFGS